MEKYAMISQPMAGKSDEEIKREKAAAEEVLKNKGYTVINTFFEGQWTEKENLEKEGVVQVPVKFLAKSIEKMSLCHAVYFCDGWKEARGCRIEHLVAESYGLEVIHQHE